MLVTFSLIPILFKFTCVYVLHTRWACGYTHERVLSTHQYYQQWMSWLAFIVFSSRTRHSFFNGVPLDRFHRVNQALGCPRATGTKCRMRRPLLLGWKGEMKGLGKIRYGKWRRSQYKRLRREHWWVIRVWMRFFTRFRASSSRLVLPPGACENKISNRISTSNSPMILYICCAFKFSCAFINRIPVFVLCHVVISHELFLVLLSAISLLYELCTCCLAL